MYVRSQRSFTFSGGFHGDSVGIEQSAAYEQTEDFSTPFTRPREREREREREDRRALRAIFHFLLNLETMHVCFVRCMHSLRERISMLLTLELPTSGG